jgi:two-component SAPR family response regulator
LDRFARSAGDESSGYNDGGQWPEIIQLLRLVRSDYQGLRRQLEQVDASLAERELAMSQRLEHTVQISSGVQTLCLLPHLHGNTFARMGSTALAGTVAPAETARPPRLEVYCLGRFEIRSALGPIKRWHSARAKSVLQYLMTRPREPVIKDVLMEALWPDCDPRSANNNLKAAIHGLRQTLRSIFQDDRGLPYVVFAHGSYLVNSEIEVWLDVEQFERHWKLGQRFEKAQRVADAIHEYELAEELYHGDYLQDEAYEDWTLLRREALKDIYLIILGKLADHSLGNGDHVGCIDYSQQILATDACREDAYRRLMRCYSRLGQRNRALRWYEICQRTVETELDTAPDAETTVLYEQLLRHEVL